MRVRSRCVAVAGVGVALAVWAVVLGEPVALAGSVGVGGWLLAQQYRFVRATARTAESLAVGYSPVRTHVTAGETSPMTLVVSAEDELPVATTVEPSRPAGVEGSPTALHLEPGEQSGVEGYEARWAVAGDHTFDQPTVRLRDEWGLFEQTTQVGPTTTVTVDPRAPRDVHVGEGGDQAATAYGEHAAGRLASGIEPSSVRPYIPGDAVRQIDWNATARLGEPHVREFVGETDRVTVVFFDHRTPMADGPDGQTKVDYARQVGLAFVDSARRLSDPLGCYTVGDEGVTYNADPGANADHQQAIRKTIEDLEPTGGRTPVGPTGKASAARAQRLRSRLDPDTRFGRRLHPYLTSTNAYVERIAEQPMFQAVESVTSRVGGTIWTVLLTDDTARTELRETVKVASRTQGGVMVFLTPSVLFDTDAVDAVDAAYERYVDFESFRRELASYPDVWAFEVGPGDRLSGVLAAGESPATQVQGGWHE